MRTARSIKIRSCLAAAYFMTSSPDMKFFIRSRMYRSSFSSTSSSTTIDLNVLITLQGKRFNDLISSAPKRHQPHPNDMSLELSPLLELSRIQGVRGLDSETLHQEIKWFTQIGK